VRSLAAQALNTSSAISTVSSSPTFTVNTKYINLLVGGGNHPYPGNNDATAVLLLVNGKTVNSAPGQDNEALNWAA